MKSLARLGYRRIAALGLALVMAAAPSPTTAQTPPVTKTNFSDCAGCPDMVIIPAGSAVLGSTDEERARAGILPLFGDREGPTYKVRFAKAYAIGRTEITRAQYAAFVKATKRADVGGCGVHDAKADTWGPQPGFSWHKPGFKQDDTHPVVCISYDDAVAYTVWLSKLSGKAYRLPSDAEWEYAARGGTKTPWYWGDLAESGCGAANLLSAGTVASLGFPNSVANRLVCSSSRSFTVPVASFAPNPFGLYDVAGNAFEWAADCNSRDNRDAHSDGSARTAANQGTDCSKRYLKGGAFHTPFWLTRHAVRGAPIPSDLHMFAVGFRVARVIE